MITLANLRSVGSLALGTSLFVCSLMAPILANAQAQNTSQSPVGAVTAPTPAQLADPAWIDEGRVKFIHTCSYCHGEAGDAGKNKPFRDHLNWDPQAIHDTISDGRTNGANIMPSWEGSIPDDEIWKIVAYIRSLAGKPK